MRPLRKNSTTTMMTMENTTRRKPLRNTSGALMPRNSPESRPRSHHSEAATNSMEPITEPEMEPIPPSTTISNIS